MPLEVKHLTRIFKFKKDGKDLEVADPNPEFTVEEVMKFYSGTYPELTNGFVDGPTVEKDKAVYKMTTKAGQLG